MQSVAIIVSSHISLINWRFTAVLFEVRKHTIILLVLITMEIYLYRIRERERACIKIKINKTYIKLTLGYVKNSTRKCLTMFNKVLTQNVAYCV